MDIEASTNFSITGAFYAVGAGQGEGVLTNPTTGKCMVVDSVGVQIGGSPFALQATAGARTGIYTTGALNIAATGYYSYVFYDNTDPTPTITHTNGFFHIVNNSNDDLDAEIDTLTTNLATANAALSDIKGASFNTATDSLKIVSDNVDTINLATDTLEASATTIVNATDTLEASATTLLADTVLIKGYTDSLETSMTAVLTTSGPGAGTIHVTINTGGANNLKPVLAAGAAVAGVLIEAYLTSDWDAGNHAYATYGKGKTTSTSTGAFSWDLMLSAAAYTLVYTLAGYQQSTKTVTVS